MIDLRYQLAFLRRSIKRSNSKGIYGNGGGIKAGDVSNITGDLTGVRGIVSVHLHGDISMIHGDVSKIWGCISQVRGNTSEINGDISGVWGDVSHLHGCVTDFYGDAAGIESDDLSK